MATVAAGMLVVSRKGRFVDLLPQCAESGDERIFDGRIVDANVLDGQLGGGHAFIEHAPGLRPGRA